MERPAEVRQRAIDEAKRGGNPTVAVALAMVYVGDRIAELGLTPSTERAVGQIAAELSGICKTLGRRYA